MLVTASTMSTATTRTTVLLFFICCAMALIYNYGMEILPVPPQGPTRPWQEVVAEKRRADNDKIPVQWRLGKGVIDEAKSRTRIAGEFIEGLLDRATLHITSTDPVDLLAGMANGSLTAVEVVTAFCKRAAFAHQLSNLLLEIGFDDAIARAEELDHFYAKHGKLVGPLHGLPVTFKDQFHVKGLGTTMGYVGWIDTFEGKKNTGKDKKFESEVVRELRSLGAIPIAKTTLVQSLWAPETNNNILGYTLNPWNQRLSSGGSSGGEGALQALRGSAFGVGSDVGGSVSMPAAFQGVFGFKPSSGRIAFKDVASSGLGQQVIPTVAGLMGNSLATLQLVFRSLLSTEPWLHDPFTLPIPWREEKVYSPAKEPGYTPEFGFMENDRVVAPHPPVKRALEIVRKALEESGHRLHDWAPPSNNESAQIHGPIARGDGCPDVWDAIQLSGEPIVPEIGHLFPGGRPRQPLPLPDFENVVIHMKSFRTRYQDYWMSSAKRTDSGRPVEAVISPSTPYAGVLPGKFKYSQYTSSLNVLDFPNVVIPVTFADKTIDQVKADYKPLTETDRLNMALYDPEAHDGAAVSVQIFGRNWDEERLLSMAQLVVDALEKYAAKHGRH